jgi:hypothetical protein
LALEKKLADEKALEEIERRRNKEREEEMQRARDRVAASKLSAISPPPSIPNDPPAKKIKKTVGGVETPKAPLEWPLNPTKEYTLEYLDAIVVTEEMYSQDPDDIYEDRRSYATYKSRAHGWADSKYAKDGVEE